MTQPTAANPKVTTCRPVDGYPPRVGRFVAQLAEVREKLLGEVHRLTVQQIDWRPDPLDRVHRYPAPPPRRHRVVVDATKTSAGVSPGEYPGIWEEALPIRVGAPQVSGRELGAYGSRLEATRWKRSRSSRASLIPTSIGWSAKPKPSPTSSRGVTSIRSSGSSGTSSSTKRHTSARSNCCGALDLAGKGYTQSRRTTSYAPASPAEGSRRSGARCARGRRRAPPGAPGMARTRRPARRACGRCANP